MTVRTKQPRIPPYIFLNTGYQKFFLNNASFLLQFNCLFTFMNLILAVPLYPSMACFTSEMVKRDAIGIGYNGWKNSN